MRRLMIIIQLILVLALQAQEIRVRVPDTTIIAGDELLLPVYVDSSVTGLSVTAYQLELKYNGSHLEPVGLEFAGTMSDQFSMSFQAIPGNSVKIAGAGATELTGKGVLFFVRFKSLSNGNSWMEFTNTASNYFNEGGIPLILVRGYMRINAPPNINVNVNKTFVKPGDPIQANASGGTAPYVWELTNNAIASVNSSGEVSTTSHGAFRVKATDSQGYFDSSNVVNVAPFFVWLPDTTEWQGGHLKLPVYFSKMSSVDALSGELRFTFNSNLLLNPELVLEGTLLENRWADINNSVDGQVSISFAGTNPLPSNGVLCYITFDVSTLRTGSGNLNFNQANINQDELVFTQNGRFRTINWATINVTGNNYMMAGQSYQYNANGGVTPYSWESGNDMLATVNSEGAVSALMGGIVSVKATDDVGASGTKENIMVYDLQAEIPDTIGPLNSWTTIPVYVTAIPNARSYSAYELVVTFNSNFLEFKNTLTAGTHSENWSIFNKVEGNDVKIVAAGSNQVSKAGVLLTLQFLLKPNFNINQTAYVNFKSLMLNEGTPTVRTENGSIKAADITDINSPLSDDAFRVFPNPSNGRFTIWLDQSHNFTSLRVFSVSGELIATYSNLQQNVLQLDFSHENGIYFIEAESPNRKMLKRISIY